MSDEDVIELGDDGTFDVEAKDTAQLAAAAQPDTLLSPTGEVEAAVSEADSWDGYEDAAEELTGEAPNDGPGHETAATESPAAHPPAQPQPAAAPDARPSERCRWISPGLVNIQLPLPSGQRHHKRARPKEDTAEPLEEAYHDSFDEMASMRKDAEQARQMKDAGNEFYKRRDFSQAADHYTLALEYCPDGEQDAAEKAVYYCNRAACHLQFEEWQQVVDDCTSALVIKPGYVKALMRRAQAYEQLKRYDQALEDNRKVLEVEPGAKLARDNVPRLETLHKEHMEHMKEEAIGKLKDLGNSLLGRFGMSIDNFKVQQDPTTGSYSINFQK